MPKILLFRTFFLGKKCSFQVNGHPCPYLLAVTLFSRIRRIFSNFFHRFYLGSEALFLLNCLSLKGNLLQCQSGLWRKFLSMIRKIVNNCTEAKMFPVAGAGRPNLISQEAHSARKQRNNYLFWIFPPFTANLKLLLYLLLRINWIQNPYILYHFLHFFDNVVCFLFQMKSPPDFPIFKLHGARQKT